MLVIDSFGKNVYIDKKLVGYISFDGEIFISGKKFGILEDNGGIIIILEGKKIRVGYVEDNGDVFFKNKQVGYINEANDIVFYGSMLNVK